jgi:hypothetical protein
MIIVTAECDSLIAMNLATLHVALKKQLYTAPENTMSLKDLVGLQWWKRVFSTIRI